MYETHGGAPPLELLNVSIDDPAAAVTPAANAPGRSRWRFAVVAAFIAVMAAGVAWGQLREPAAVALPPGDPGTAPEAAEPPIGLSGFAELYVSAYLTAAGPDQDATIRRFYPAAPAAEPRTLADRYATRIVTTGARETSPGRWDVEVAAEVLAYDGNGYRSDGVHHFLVGIAASEYGLAATSLPARIAAPPSAPVPAVVVGSPVEDESLLALVDGFLSALLIGEGDVRSYVAPSSPLVATQPPAYRSLTGIETTALVAPDGTVRLRAVAVATPASGASIVVEYHLVVEESGGSWRIASLAAGPPSPSDVAGPDASADPPAGQG